MSIQGYTPLSIILIIFYIIAPILIIYLLARVIRASTTPHQREVQRLLREVLDSLKENYRLLAQIISANSLDRKQN